ncbi:MAG: lipopolysaccharide heptosyltransferase II [Leptospiraceae bacterium]|nr:lipopolysaccharide heptosyltransferase II [Leptospiraceae bacterium]
MPGRKILLIQTAFIGDVVLTTPAIRAIKHHFPDDELSVLIKPESLGILANHPDLHQVLVIDKKGRHKGPRGMAHLIRQIREQRFDLLLSPHQSHRSALIAWRSKIPMRIGYKGSGFARLAWKRQLIRDPGKAEIERLLDFVDQALGTNSASLSRQPELHIDPGEQQKVRALCTELGVHRPVLIAPSSVWATKRWTTGGFAELCRLITSELRQPVLLIGSPSDEAIAANIILLLEKLYPPAVRAMVHNICGRTSLAGLYALMQSSSMLISNDSAPVHFGCAAGIPVVAIFGATTPSLGYAPITANSRIAERTDLACRPCGTHGAERCPRKHFECMRGLEAESVMQAVRDLWPG